MLFLGDVTTKRWAPISSVYYLTFPNLFALPATVKYSTGICDQVIPAEYYLFFFSLLCGNAKDWVWDCSMESSCSNSKP